MANLIRFDPPPSDLQIVLPVKEDCQDVSTVLLSARSDKQRRASSCSRTGDSAGAFPKRRSMIVALDSRITDLSLPARSKEARAADPFMTSFMAAWDFACGNTLAPEARVDSAEVMNIEAEQVLLDTDVPWYQSRGKTDAGVLHMTSSKRESRRITDVPIPRPSTWICQQQFAEKLSKMNPAAEDVMGA